MSERVQILLIEAIFATIFIVTWLAGIVLATGAVRTVVACIFPPYGWYLLVETMMVHFGLI